MSTDPVARLDPGASGGAGSDHEHAGPAQRWPLPAERGSVAVLRDHAVAFARAHGADQDVLSNVALAVSEAVTNSVLHAFQRRPAGTVTVTAQAHPDRLIVTVADDGDGMRPRADSPGFGMGLPLMGHLTSGLDIHEAPGGGTVVRMTFAAPGVDGPPPRRRREDGASADAR